MNRIGLNSNMIKIIAFIAVIFDHIAVYFYNKLTPEITLYFRIMGRIAMPIFAFLIVQGFFHTKDLTKYIKRLIISGVITQMLIYILHIINKFIFNDYVVQKSVLGVNILISFAISLIVLKVVDNLITIIIEKKKIKKQDILLIILSVSLISMYFITDFDYSYKLIIYVILVYIIEKIVKQKNLFKDKYISKFIYILLNFMALLIFAILYNSQIEYFAIFSIIFISLYNGKKGKDSKVIKTLFYTFYPLQHFILYLMAMIIC